MGTRKIQEATAGNDKFQINFFQSMHLKGTKKPVIAYGSANFACNGRGEVSVPVKYVKEKCKPYFETVDVDEFRTSLFDLS